MLYESLKDKLPHVYKYMQAFQYTATWSSVNRYVFLDEIISNLVYGKTVVETGTYSGCLTYAAYHHGAKKAVGFDIRNFLIEKANKTLKVLKVPENKCNFVLADAIEFDYSEFDIVLCLGLLYNIKDEDKHRVLEKMNGQKVLMEFWCLCDDIPNLTTTIHWPQSGGSVQYMPNRTHAEKMIKEHGYHFEEVTPSWGGFKTPPFTNRYYLCKPKVKI